MEDDLDDFFDEIEEAEAQVKGDEKEGDQDGDDETPLGKEVPSESNEATDLVDATSSEDPPTKRQKVENAPPARPRGLVVAAASSAVVRKAEEEPPATNTASASAPAMPAVAAIPPPPPPPPPPGALPNNNMVYPSVPAGSKKPVKRMAAGKVWVDPTLEEWPENDFRIFCGNLDPSVTDQQLHDHFVKYTSIAKAKVVTNESHISRGYGFVSFLQPLDCAKAIREMDQTWLGSRPIRVKRSDWKDRNLSQVQKQQKRQSKQRRRMGL
eukprot:Nitzschia sp. Nitz4//scaffold43_size134323//24155//24958//NITZ4_003283-RA/size134323-processed-gene-0.31-mRNA-1//-1//CDS//3329551900//3820//frame0